MQDAPVRVAVISPNPLVRIGLVGLISQLGAHALVTEAVEVDRQLLSHDVAIYDIGAVAHSDSYEGLQALLDSDAQVIALVYDRVLSPLPDVLGETTHVITISVTADDLLRVLAQATGTGTHTAGAHTEGDLPAGLSGRELEVLRMVAGDLSNDEIAARLHLSLNTIKTYIRTGYRKIGVANRSGAIHWAIRHGLAGDTAHDPVVELSAAEREKRQRTADERRRAARARSEQAAERAKELARRRKALHDGGADDSGRADAQAVQQARQASDEARARSAQAHRNSADAHERAATLADEAGDSATRDRHRQAAGEARHAAALDEAPAKSRRRARR